MSFEDKTLQCVDCQKDFVFTAGEQEFYQTRGFTNTPKRCEDCRTKRKAQGGGGGGSRGDSPRRGGGGGGGGGGRGGRGMREDRPKFAATCSRCGAAFDAPFQPKEGRPVFCRPCFEASKGGGRH